MIQQPNKAETIERVLKQTGGQFTPMKHGKFYGRLESDKPTGHGMFEFLNGDIFCGNFKGTITGTGTRLVI